MLTTKNTAGDAASNQRNATPGRARFIAALTLTIFAVTGCRPPGPSALLDGKDLLDQGEYTQAIGRLKTATSILGTNAQAWNYLGVAYHQAGQAPEAADAYKRALALDQNLVEAHYNLGCLLLEQNHPDLAKGELTAFTLRRGDKSPEGWVKLGEAQARLHDLTGAENSFNRARQMETNYPEALNGLGVVQMQRNHTTEAAQYFNAAAKAKPDYAPAILNLAIVSQLNLNNRQYALERYQDYLGLKPRSANWEAVQGAARALEQEVKGPSAVTARPPPPASNTVAQSSNAARTQTSAPARVAPPKIEQPPAANVRSQAPAPASTTPTEVVQLQPEQTVHAADDTSSGGQPEVMPQSGNTAASNIAESPKEKHGFFSRVNPANLFRSSPKTNTPPAPIAAAPPVAQTSAPTVSYSRYTYRSPRKPADGDRGTAEKAFAAGSEAFKAGEFSEATTDYRKAVEADPGYFDAYYNLGVVSVRSGNPLQALVNYETALAIQPDSHDARFNFALVLKQANYPIDAANELEKLLVKYPNDPNAHYVLANIYAQQLRQTAKAREHYQKVLELNPAFSQAQAVHDWLWANPR